MTTSKMAAGDKFPDIEVPKLGGGTTKLSTTTGPNNWKLVVTYRGKHCPLCAKQLTELKDHIAEFAAAGVDVIAVSADSAEKVQAQMDQLQPSYDVAYDLSVAQMQDLGL